MLQTTLPVALFPCRVNTNPPFYGNKGLDVDPRFVNEKGFDLHLLPNSPLIGKGIVVQDADWGTPEGAVDVGAFGLRIRR